MIESLENALVRATEMIADPIQVRRIVISGKRRKHTPAFTRIDIRPVEIKGALHFQLVGHDGKQDTTRNLSPEGFSLLELMNEGFGNLLIETFDEELNVRVTKSGEAQVSLRKVVLESSEKSISRDIELSFDHDSNLEISISLKIPAQLFVAKLALLLIL